MARRTKQEAEETRQALLDAAEEVFYVQGVAKTTLEHIAEKAGTTRGAIHWHFKDKSGLIDAMTERIGLPIIESIQDVMKERQADHLLMVVTIFLQPLRIIARDEKTRRVLFITSHLAEYWLDPKSEHSGSYDGKQSALIQYQQSLSGAANDHEIQLRVHAPLAAQGLCSLFFGLLESWVLKPQSFDLVEVACMALYIYLNGMGFDKSVLGNYGLGVLDN